MPEVVFVAVDEHGELMERVRCQWLLTNIRSSMGGSSRASALDVERKMNELKKLERFFYESGCEAVALGACDLSCRRIKEELEHISFAMALRSDADPNADMWADKYYRAARPHQEAPLGDDNANISRMKFDDLKPFRCVLVDETIPQLWANTGAAQSEVAELTPPLRTALACARSLQDPYTETCHALAPDALHLTQLPLHSLMSALPEEPLRRALTHQMVEGACRLGVSITDALEHDHRAHVLPFVPGLGPRKAVSLLRALQARASTGRSVEDRDGMHELLGTCVWHNAVGFLNFGAERQSKDGYDRPPGLEGSRIHPEHYEQAKKMCFDAMLDPDIDEDQIDESDAAMLDAVDKAMSPEGLAYQTGTNEKISTLSELDFDEFAEHLQQQGARIGVQTIQDVVNEVSVAWACWQKQGGQNKKPACQKPVCLRVPSCAVRVPCPPACLARPLAFPLPCPPAFLARLLQPLTMLNHPTLLPGAASLPRRPRRLRRGGPDRG